VPATHNRLSSGRGRSPTGRKINSPLGKIEVAEEAADRCWTKLLPAAVWPRLFRGIGSKRGQALTFLATFENDHLGMKTLAVVSILALLTISGAAFTDQILTSDQQTAQRAN
jgi:hypothetical protein